MAEQTKKRKSDNSSTLNDVTLQTIGLSSEVRLNDGEDNDKANQFFEILPGPMECLDARISRLKQGV